MSTTLRIGFFALILVTLSALFIPQIYSFLADFTLKQMGTLENIQKFDEDFIVDDIAEETENIWQDIESFFTGNDKQEEEVKEDQKGLLEENLYPSLVTAVSFLYRALAIILSIAGLIGIIYLSYATSGTADIKKLESKLNALQERIEHLETKQNTP